LGSGSHLHGSPVLQQLDATRSGAAASPHQEGCWRTPDAAGSPVTMCNLLCVKRVTQRGKKERKNDV
ncbi:hypothetical protein DNTS_021889, partial [Danionella cerebrum]